MTYDDFRALVFRMRDAQRHYFKSRDPNALTEARKLESEVDRAIVHGGMQSMFATDDRRPK